MLEQAMLLIGLALLSGCGTLENRYGAERLPVSEITAESSFVVLSAGAPDKCISTSTFLRLKPATEPYNGKDVALLNVDGYAAFLMQRNPSLASRDIKKSIAAFTGYAVGQAE